MRLSVMSLIAATMILAGCTRGASNQRSTAAGAAPALDTAKMAAVEQVALSRGVRVFWVNPPSKH